MSEIKLAVIQTALSNERDKNIAKLTGFVEKAAAKNVQIILLPELFESHYFPRETKKEFFKLAQPLKGNETIAHFQNLARKYKMVIPISFFEKDGERYFNSLAFIDEKGEVRGLYRKSFIPSGPGYEEKYYFQFGDTGFKTWETSYGKIGVGICWDQWFPEAARAMTVQGADLLLYPTCIGSEPEPPHLDTRDLWRRVMIGHTVANVIPLAAANRIGTEGGQTYYGSSFIADYRGELLQDADRKSEELLIASLDFAAARKAREDFGLIADYLQWQSLQKTKK